MSASFQAHLSENLSHPPDRMTILRELLEEFGRNTPLDLLFQNTAVRISEIFGDLEVSIWTRDSNSMAKVAGTGRSSTKRASLGRGPVGLCAATRAPVFSMGDPGKDGIGYHAAVPILVNGQAQGVVSVECQGAPLPDSDAHLLLALTGGLAGAMQSERTRQDGMTVMTPKRQAGGGTRRVVLRGQTCMTGKVVGPVVALRRIPRHAHPQGHPEQGVIRSVRGAFETVRSIVRDLSNQARRLEIGRSVDFLPAYEAMLEDERYRDMVLEQVVRGQNIHEAMKELTSAMIRGWSEEPDAHRRTAEVEDLFAALAMFAQQDRRASLPRSCILVGANLSPYDLLVTARSKPVGVVLTEPCGEHVAGILRLLDRPALGEVTGATHWVSDGDIALLDATGGYLLLNPTRAEVAALRDAPREEDGNPLDSIIL